MSKIKKIKSSLIFTCIIFSLFSLICPTALADQFPVTYEGYTRIDGNLTGAGANVTVRVNGTVVAWDLTDGNSVYLLHIDSTYNGSTGIFRVNNTFANQSTIGDPQYWDGNTLRYRLDLNASINHRPNAPTLISPTPTGVLDQGISVTLQWNCSDPDGDNITYDVYFSTSNPPTTKVSNNQTAKTLARTGLSYFKWYYWKIEVWDNHSAKNESDVWLFRTKSSGYTGNGDGGGDTTPPTTPTNVQCTTPENDSTPSFSWNASTDTSGIAGYYVKIDNDTDTGVGNVLTWNSTSSIEDGNHTFYVKAKDASSNGNTGNYGSCLFTINTTGGISPVADANGPYQGLVNQTITFNGSASYDSDGTIVNYTWDFGDETAGYGINPTHAYTTAGEFTVNLTVTDNHGLTNTTTTTANITLDTDGDGYSDDIETSYGTNTSDPNDYPLDTDGDGIPDDDSPDGNYTGDPDDDNDNLPDTIENAVGSNSKDPTNKTAFRELSISGTTHYLVDTNNDGTYDAFYNSVTGTTTATTIDADGKYLIDYNGDGTIDYIYDPASGAVTSYEPEEEFPWTIVMIIAMILVIIIIIVAILFKTGYLYIEEKPKKKQEKTKKKK